MTKDYSDAELVALYQQWSEEFWCAGFISPVPDIVASFRKWLNTPVEVLKPPSESYHFEFLAEYKKQLETGGENG